MTIGIYKITNTVNSKVYIGSSINIESRWKNHLSVLSCGHHENTGLQKDYNLYGVEAFSFQVLEEIETDDNDFISDREEYWTEKIRQEGVESYNPKRPKRRSVVTVFHGILCDVCGRRHRVDPMTKHPWHRKRSKIQP